MDNSVTFNMAELTNYRIHVILLELKQYRHLKRYSEWFKAIQDLFLETISFLTAKEQAEFNRHMRTITERARDIKRIKDDNNKTIEQVPIDLPALMLQFEVDSRLLLYKKGVLTAKTQDPSRLL